MIDGRDGQSPAAEVFHEVGVAPDVLGVAVRDEDDPARRARDRRRAVPVDRHAADPGERPF
jgi:hypothetical protein